MRLDVLGRRRALWCSMRRWRSMLLAAAKQCVQPPLVLVKVLPVLLCVCFGVCVFGLCLRLCLCLCLCVWFVCVLHVACFSQTVHMCSSRCAEQPRSQEFATQKHGRDVLRMSACALRRNKWFSSSSSSSS